MTSYAILIALIRTEKGTLMEAKGRYLFQVARNATKIGIKNAVEEIYKVEVDDVNTMIVPAKRKRVRQQYGYTSDWKKAIVKLKEGHKIEAT